MRFKDRYTQRNCVDNEYIYFSKRDLQDVFGFATPQAIYKWKHGAAMPTIDNLVVLAAIFGVAMDDIVVVDRDVKAQISA